LTEVLDSTKEVRDQVQSDLAVVWDPERVESHTMTIQFLLRSMIHMGQNQESEKLRDQALGSSSLDLVKSMMAYPFYTSEAYAARGDFESALEPLRAQNFSNGSQHQLMLRAVRQGNLAAAEKMIDTLATTERTKPSRGNYARSSLLLLSAELAIAAWKAGEHPRIDPALHRYRAVMERASTPSTRPLDESTDWLLSDPEFGLYFVNVLASTGRGAFAESLWNNPKWNPLFRGTDGKGLKQAAMHLCGRLAFSGEVDTAIRVATSVFGDEIPAEIYYWLCIRAANDRDSQGLEQLSSVYLSKVEALCFFESMSTLPNVRTLSDRAKTMVKLGQAGLQLNRFVSAMNKANSRPIAARGAELYMKMADRFVAEFEHQTVADLRRVREINDYPFTLEPIVKAIEVGQAIEFAKRLDSFIAGNTELLENPLAKGLRLGLLEERIYALAGVGHSPRVEQVANWPFRFRHDLANRLFEAGEKESASAVFESLYKEAWSVASLSYVSGSSGGRVVNGATQNRYAAAELAVRLDKLQMGIEIIETIKHEGERVDGYRCLGHEFAKSAGVKQAFEWARSLSDGNYRLAACVGIVQSETERITAKQPGELELFLDNLIWLGVPSILWGC
jgi:hypothetical protein